MRIKSIKVGKLHGIFTKKIKFFDDYTFVHGINGTGKTSIIKAMEAVLTPDLEWLVHSSYDYIEIIVEHFHKYTFKFTKNENSINIRQRKGNEYISEEIDLIRVNTIIKNKERSIQSTSANDPTRALIFQEFSKSEIIRRIQDIPTPMFLGLNRTAFLEREYETDLFERRAQRNYPSPEQAGDTLEKSLIEAQKLIYRSARQMIQRRRAHETKLRNDITFLLFSLPPDRGGLKFNLPSRNDLLRYRRMRTEISQTLQKLGYNPDRIVREIDPFFDSLASNGRALLKFDSLSDAMNKSMDDPSLMRAINIWIDSVPVLSLIDKYFDVIETFNKKVLEIRSEITQFELIVNGFFQDSGKYLDVSESGDVILRQSEKLFDVSRLSSGEKQIFILLSQLSFNPLLKKANVLVIDEPEISLHVRWQEIFVDGIMQANPSTQLILATHSPSIVLDRTSNMVDLNAA